jgi:hypothetical protein
VSEAGAIRASLEGRPSSEATYVTIADSSYFVGAVAFVNSFRLTGNRERIVVIDAGLTDEQRALLATECDVCPPPVSKSGVFVVFLKSAVYLMGLRGTVVLIDSDVVITRRMAPISAEAAAGRICVVGIGSDVFANRRFPEEWASVLGIDEPIRAQRNVGAGLIALDIDRWAGFMRRWHELCERVPEERAALPFDLPSETVSVNPFAFPEQDVMNALLSSEVPAGSMLDIGVDASPGPPHNDVVRVVDRSRLRCRIGSDEPFLLHYWDHPKPWFPNARAHLVFDAYVELMARLLTADDVPLRLSPNEVPLWLRDDLKGKLVRRSPRLARRGVRRVASLLPDPLEQRVRDLGGAVASKVRLG